MDQSSDQYFGAVAWNVFCDVVLGSLAGIPITLVLAFIGLFFAFGGPYVSLIYLLHAPLLFFVVKKVSERPAFRCAFALPCLFEVGLTIFEIWMGFAYPGNDSFG